MSNTRGRICVCAKVVLAPSESVNKTPYCKDFMGGILASPTVKHPHENSGILWSVRLGLVMLTIVCGCAAPNEERRETACRVAQESHDSIARASGRDLLRFSLDTPAEEDARSAYAQEISVTVLGVLGGAALLTGLIDGFATNPATQPAARNAAYGLGGGALASFALAWLLSYTQRIPRERARATLLDWGQRCGK
jgi:hypothetical protein